MPVTNLNEAVIKQRVDGLKTLIHGVSATLGQNAWGRLDFQMPSQAHIQKVDIAWVDAKVGDYGFLVVIHPGGDTNPAQAVAQGATEVTLESAELAALYGAALAMEFWNDADDTLIERHQVDSVDGAVVTLKTATTQAHGVGANLRAMLDTYSPCLGGTNVTAGYKMVGSSRASIASESELTAAIPQGVILGTRFKTADVAGDRAISVNYRLRECDETCAHE